MLKKVSIMATIVALCLNTVVGQQLANVLEASNLMYCRDFVVQTMDGQTLKAEKISTMSVVLGKIKSLAVKTDDGVKHKLKAEQIKSVQARMTKMAKIGAITDAISKDITSANAKKFRAIADSNLVRYERIEYKPGKFAVMQLLNYGYHFDVKVFPNPFSESQGTSVGGMKMGGGKLREYYIKKGDKFYTINKKTYPDEYNALFGDKAKTKNPASIEFDNLNADIVKYTF